MQAVPFAGDPTRAANEGAMSGKVTIEDIDRGMERVFAAIFRPASDETPYDWQYAFWVKRFDEDEDEDEEEDED